MKQFPKNCNFTTALILSFLKNAQQFLEKVLFTFNLQHCLSVSGQCSTENVPTVGVYGNDRTGKLCFVFKKSVRSRSKEWTWHCCCN